MRTRVNLCLGKGAGFEGYQSWTEGRSFKLFESNGWSWKVKVTDVCEIESIIGGSCYKYHFCHDKTFVPTKLCLSRQKTCFVATNTCLSRQKQVCRDKSKLVATKVLSRQTFVATIFPSRLPCGHPYTLILSFLLRVSVTHRPVLARSSLEDGRYGLSDETSVLASLTRNIQT